jgi:hypothetical protein
MEIDQELAKFGLKRITIFQYNVEICLFDAIAY